MCLTPLPHSASAGGGGGRGAPASAGRGRGQEGRRPAAARPQEGHAVRGKVANSTLVQNPAGVVGRGLRTVLCTCTAVDYTQRSFMGHARRNGRHSSAPQRESGSTDTRVSLPTSPQPRFVDDDEDVFTLFKPGEAKAKTKTTAAPKARCSPKQHPFCLSFFLSRPVLALRLRS